MTVLTTVYTRLCNLVTKIRRWSQFRQSRKLSIDGLLTYDEEMFLGMMVKSGTQRDCDLATAIFIDCNVRLVSSMTKRFRHRGCEHDDMMTDGMLGLHHAVQRYDYTKGHRFSTYATNWIRQAIGRGIENRGRDIRLPSHAIAKLTHIRMSKQEYIRKTGTTPSSMELLAYVHEVKHTYPKYLHKQIDCLTVERLDEIMRHDQNLVTSIDEANMYGQSLYDYLPSGDTVDAQLDRDVLIDQLRELMNVLTDREIAVLRLRYGFDGLSDDRSLEDVGILVGYSRERIRQIQCRALQKLRTSPGADVLLETMEKMDI